MMSFTQMSLNFQMIILQGFLVIYILIRENYIFVTGDSILTLREGRLLIAMLQPNLWK